RPRPLRRPREEQRPPRQLRFSPGRSKESPGGVQRSVQAAASPAASLDCSRCLPTPPLCLRPGLAPWPPGVPSTGPWSSGEPARLDELAADPLVGAGQALLETDDGLPVQHLAQAGVVAVAATHALRLAQVVLFLDLLAGDLRHDVDQLIDRDHAVLTEIERLAEVRPHQAIDAFHAVVDVAVGPRLLAVAPHVDDVFVLGERDLAADRGPRLLAATVIGPKPTEDG